MSSQQLLSDTANQSQYHMIPLDFSQYMRLDSAACRALHIDHSPSEVAMGGSSGGHEGELVRLLNKCQTQQGRRLMAQWVRQPLLDKSKIGKSLRCALFKVILIVILLEYNFKLFSRGEA